MNKRKSLDLEELFFHCNLEALVETDKSVNKKQNSSDGNQTYYFDYSLSVFFDSGLI